MTREKPITYEQLTDGQRRCWNALAWCFGGRHHIKNVYRCGYGIRTSRHDEAATFDGGLMTLLVLAAHRWSVRIAIQNGGPGRIGITAHPRSVSAKSTMERHPALYELIARCREMKSVVDTDGDV